MVGETRYQGEKAYKCGKCGWLYRERKIAENCQEWCTKHKSCNLNYQKYVLNA